MGLKDKINLFRPEIEKALRQAVDDSLAPEYGFLKAMLTYHLGWEGEGAGPEAQGKRIRPVLLLLCCEAAGGEWQPALPAAAAVELLHNFSLIHDDIQDNSPLRRGRPTVWARWGAAQAINAGDVMFSQAYYALQGLAQTLSAEVSIQAHGRFVATCLRLTEGQYLDMTYESARELPMADYWPMVTGKTSALLGCSAELGALCAGADTARREDFYRFGLNLGLAFQVLDDWLGIWGKAETTGKSVESDLVSGKKTLPVVYALQTENSFRRRWLSGPVSANDVGEVVKLLDGAGAGEYTLKKAGELTIQALEALERAASPGKTQDLRELAEVLLSREK